MEKFIAPAVEAGDKPRDSAALRDSPGVKLFAKRGGANKPRAAAPYNLQQTLFNIDSNR